MDVTLYTRQLELVQAGEPEVVVAGRGGGKSFALRVLAAMYAGGWPGVAVGYVSLHHDSLVKTQIQGFNGLKEVLLDSGLVSDLRPDGAQLVNGSTILWSGADRPALLQRLLDSDPELVIVDDAHRIPSELLEQIMKRLEAAGGRLVCACADIEAAPWLKDRLAAGNGRCRLIETSETDLPATLQQEWGLLGSETDFGAFIREVSPGFVFYKHAEVIVGAVERLLTYRLPNQVPRLMVFGPPQVTGKSDICARHLPAYFLRKHPERWAGLASYQQQVANARSRDARALYLKHGGKLGEATGVSEWETGRGGGLWASGTGGAQTGKSSGLLIVDDPLKGWAEAASLRYQVQQREWYRSSWLTRWDPHVGVPLFQVHIQTRWSREDLGGWIQGEYWKETEEPWHVVCLQHIYDPESFPKFPDNWTVEPDWREPGEVLCPELVSLEKALELRKSRGVFFWSALDQQSPRPTAGGGMFQARYFLVVDVHPCEELGPDGEPVDPIVRSVMAWDIGAGGKRDDSLAAVRMDRLRSGRMVVSYVFEAGVAAPSVKPTMLRVIGEHPKTVEAMIPEDPAAAGAIAAADIEAAIRRMERTVHVHSPRGDKALRARPLSSAAQPFEGAEFGRITVVNADWTHRFLSVMHDFSGAKDGDNHIPDAAADAFNKLDLGVSSFYG